MIDALVAILVGLLQVLVLVLIAPLVVGCLRLVAARVQLRAGPPLLQPYAELQKLTFERRGTAARTTSWVFGAAPYIAFGCYALLGWAVPPFYLGLVPIDLLAVVYLLALARFVIALAGLDTGTSFGGMGSSREMFLNVLVEPALIVVALALALHLHSTNLAVALAGSSPVWLNAVLDSLALGCVLAALTSTALMETGRLPVDNPASNMELGMIGKALHLEYSGKALALLEWGEATRLTFFLLLLGDLLVPAGVVGTIGLISTLAAPAIFFLKLVVGIVILALFESFQVKLRLRRIVVPGAFAILLGVVAVILTSIAARLGA